MALFLIIDRARNEAEIERQAIEARSRVQHKEDLRSEWGQNTNKKIFAKSVIRKVEEMKRNEDVELEVSGKCDVNHVMIKGKVDNVHWMCF